MSYSQAKSHATSVRINSDDPQLATRRLGQALEEFFKAVEDDMQTIKTRLSYLETRG